MPDEVGGRAREFFALVTERLDFEDAIENTTPTLSPTPASGSDRRSDTLTFPPNRLSTTEGFTVQEQSEFSIAFETLTDCPMDVFVVPMEPFRAFAESDDGSGGPEEVRDGLRSLAREHSPEELRFFGAETGNGSAELSAGVHQMVFTRTCEIGTRTAVQFTADIGAGSFDD
jgi:hypothetical protein